MAAKAPEVVGQYLVYEQLGRGGMASVHRAETLGISGFRRELALKRLHEHHCADDDLVKSFIHEATLASHLRHANCAQTYDLGRVGSTYFIAMEYVPGATLLQIGKQCNTAAGLMPIPIVLTILMQVLDGLDHAHNLADSSGKPFGIVHRDVSPSNIIVSTSGLVKLIDFGIAKAESSGVRTQTGMIKGKVGYVAPEYTHGQLDARCDLFAVGVIAHELLTGRRLFDGQDKFEIMQLLRSGPIQPPSRWRPEVPRDLEDIVMTALQRDPALRWQSAAAMRIALGNFARDAKLELINQQVAEWVQWAFAQKERPESSQLARVIDQLGESSSSTVAVTTGSIAVTESADDLDAAAKTLIRTTPVKQRAVLPTKFERGTSPWLVALLIVVLLGAGAYFGARYLGYTLDLSWLER